LKTDGAYDEVVDKTSRLVSLDMALSSFVLFHSNFSLRSLSFLVLFLVLLSLFLFSSRFPMI